MDSYKKVTALILLSILISGCSTTNVKIESESYWAESKYEERKGIGVALAGGGTKASSFSMGVLSALAKEDELWNIDAISTVSGGSYAGLFLYSRLIEDNNKGKLSAEKAKRYFDDCIPISYNYKGSDRPPFEEDLIQALSDEGRFCERMVESDPLFSLEYKYLDQQYVRCRQDILEKSCSFITTTSDSSIFNIAKLLAVTAGSLPISLVSNTLFDWPINTSPSMHAYRKGMGVAYAMHPKHPDVFKAKRISQVCEDASNAEITLETSFSNCALVDNPGNYDGKKVVLDPKPQTFSDLAKLYEGDSKPPVWMLNATSAPSRSMFGWARRNQTDLHRYTFSMTPYKQGSFQYGDIDMDNNNIDLLSVATASAAFFDANQTVFGQPLRSVIGAGQHLVNLSWGIDLPHPNASKNSPYC